MKMLAKIIKFGAIGIGAFILFAVATSLIFGKAGYKAPEMAQEEKKSLPVIITPTKTPVYAAAATEKSGNDIVSVGSTAYLRIARDTNPEDVILLSPTADNYKEINDAYAVKNDPQALFGALGILSAKGFFGVSNGTQIVVVEKKGILAPLYRVIIKAGVRDVDADKLGKSGWVDRAFISKD